VSLKLILILSFHEHEGLPVVASPTLPEIFYALITAHENNL
jgi:hypothetical protein